MWRSIYFAELSQDLPQKTVQYGQFSTKVNVSLKAPRIADTV